VRQLLSTAQTKNFITHAQQSRVFFPLLFLVCFVTRLPTLFNDFYDVDELSAIVQTKEWLNGLVPGVDFAESKRALYHFLFKLSYTLFPEHGWVFLHIITIIIIFMTAVCIYHMGRIMKGEKEGMAAAILYGVLISSFNRHFMATNGEVVYNLPVTAGALFIVSALRSTTILNRLILSALSVLCVIAAMQVKFHGLILAIFIVVFLVFYLPWYKGITGKIIFSYLIIGAALAAVFAVLYIKKYPLLVNSIEDAKGMIFYAVHGRSTNPLFLTGIFLYRQGMLAVWHFIAWVPAFYLLYRFVRNRFRFRTMEESAFMVLFILTWSMVFAGGARMYYHYFMSCYPSLCLMASLALFSVRLPFIEKLRAKSVVLLMIPGLFFFSWNIKDDIIRNFAPNLFYDEGNVLFWTRAILVGSVNDYLLPNRSYKAAVDYIKSHTSPSDRIFVWGDGPNIYYFADRRIAIYHIWPKSAVTHMTYLYAENTPDSIAGAQGIEARFIEMIEMRKAELIIDTSPKGLHIGVTQFGNFAMFPYPVPPRMRQYMNEKYSIETKIDDYTIYRRKKVKQK
jgi:hypothetical protein